MRKYESAFTLIEMSVVLLIVAMLISGIFIAQSMLRSSQVHVMVTEYDSYVKAIGEFQDKFLALPGDMSGSTGYTPQAMWGADPCGCPCATSNVKTALTCNGDGNGSIGTSSLSGGMSSSNFASTISYEWFRAWQQLADAGFIQGSFTGSPGSGGTNEAVIGTNVPSSAVIGAGWTLLYFLFPSNGSPESNLLLWRDNYGHILTLGGFSSNSYTHAPVLKPEDAYALDLKIDDGMPGTGKVRAWRTGTLTSCTTGDTSQSAQTYSSNNTIQACSLVFLLGF